MSRPRPASIPFLTAVAAVFCCAAAVAADTQAPPAPAPAPAPAKPPAAKPPAAKPPAAKPPQAKPGGPAPAKPTSATHVLRNIGGPGDYGLRERLVKRLYRDEQISAAAPKVALVNGGAVLSGTMPTWELLRRTLVTTSAERGIINVTNQMQVERGTVKDPAIVKAVVDLLNEKANEYDLKDLSVSVEDGVGTLAGSVKDFASRVKAEETAGTIGGLVRVVNKLQPVTAPKGGSDDVAIRKGIVEFLRNYREFAFLGDVEVQVKDGVATLTGALPLFLGRQQAGTMTGLVGGVRQVVNRIEVDPGLQPEVLIVKEIP